MNNHFPGPFAFLGCSPVCSQNSSLLGLNITDFLQGIGVLPWTSELPKDDGNLLMTAASSPLTASSEYMQFTELMSNTTLLDEKNYI